MIADIVFGVCVLTIMWACAGAIRAYNAQIAQAEAQAQAQAEAEAEAARAAAILEAEWAAEQAARKAARAAARKAAQREQKLIAAGIIPPHYE